MTMLEKAAEALKAELGRQLNAKPLRGDASSGDWYSNGSSGSIKIPDLVRAVLLAIRDPDEATISAALKASGSSPDMEIDMKIDWQAMIDAILEERPK